MSSTVLPELSDERIRKKFILEVTGDRALVERIHGKEVETVFKEAWDEHDLGPDGRIRKRVTEATQND